MLCLLYLPKNENYIVQIFVTIPINTEVNTFKNGDNEYDTFCTIHNYNTR